MGCTSDPHYIEEREMGERVKCRSCKELKKREKVNDHWQTCFDCWEAYKAMSKILQHYDWRERENERSHD